ncbi:MAG TPA: hypothetical protein VM261_16435 [Kofleriaceae bacterium]|nr:hypothetical protein [Kofleriaceae bacterium]
MFEQDAGPNSMMRSISPRVFRLSFVTVLLFGACKFPELDPVEVDARTGTDGDVGGDAMTDAEVDAPVACAPSTIDCDDATDVYTECSAQGVATFQMMCPLGCSTTAEKCVDIDPSNGLAMYLDMAATAPDLVLTGTSTINPDTGAILVGGTGVVVPTFTTANDVRVFVVKSLSLQGTTSVLLDYETYAIAFVSHGDVSISGLFDISAQGSQGGAGAAWGFDQGSMRGCTGGYPAQLGPGAGGGGGAELGGRGGSTSSASGSSGGAVASYAEPLLGGCEGGGVIGTQQSSQSVGGGGGGALQITSRTRIELSGSGVIDASGGGASHTPAGGERLPGAGGGGGGNIVLEAPQVILDGANVVISTKGGGGAGASTSTTASGTDGGFDAARAPGGNSSISSHGGAGANGTQGPGAGLDAGCSGCQGGGGGGAAGLTVFRNIVGAIAPQNGAAVRSKQMTTTIRTRLVP